MAPVVVVGVEEVRQGFDAVRGEEGVRALPEWDTKTSVVVLC
nr:hypothetical protein [Streptomyces pini]